MMKGSDAPVSAAAGAARDPAAEAGSAHAAQAEALARAARPAMTLARLQRMHRADERIAMLAIHDATSAALAAEAGVDCILVGDSLGMVFQGHDSTLPVSLDDMAYHVSCVHRGVQRAGGGPLIIADMPFGSYGGSVEAAFVSACRLMKAGAAMVKIEGGDWTAPVVEHLVSRGIPVCAHLGLTPQHVHALGGYRVQGRSEEAAGRLLREARELQLAGASMLVLEMVPAPLAVRVTEALDYCATIGIGAGAGTAGQVLVMQDMLGATLGRVPRFVRNFLKDAGSIQAALRAYVADVRGRRFPVDAEHAWEA